MRRFSWLLSLSVLLAGCDPALLEAVVAELPPTVAATASPGAAPAASGAGALPRSLAPLDLEGQDWVADQPGLFRLEGNRIVIEGEKDTNAALLYRAPLGEDFSLSFSETREDAPAYLWIRWMLDPATDLAPGPDGEARPTAESEMELRTDKVMIRRGKETVLTHTAPKGPRRWTLAVEDGSTTITLNGETLAHFENPAGYHPTPWLWIHAWQWREGSMSLDDVSVRSGPLGPRQAIVRQWSLEGLCREIRRFSAIFPSDLAEMPSAEAMNALPAIAAQIDALGPRPLKRIEALAFARVGQDRGSVHSGRGLYLYPTRMTATTTAGHEMAHSFGQAGSTVQPRGPETWLSEGMANYFGYAALQRHQGLPSWATAPLDAIKPDDPPLSEADAETLRRSDKWTLIWKNYQKGRIFFSVMAAFTSEEDVRAVMAANGETPGITGESFLQALEARTGQDLAFLRPGWLVAGDYQRVGVKDATDTDGDGLLDFQEIAWGTRPETADSDGDGASDFAERAAGSDPASPLDKPTALDGFGPGAELGPRPLPPLEAPAAHE